MLENITNILIIINEHGMMLLTNRFTSSKYKNELEIVIVECFKDNDHI